MAPRAKDYIKSLPHDLTAAVVVFLVALPLCLGVALASGAPPLSGIIAGIAGGLVVGLASRSHLSVSGPAAGLTAIVLAAIATIGSFEGFLVAVVLGGVLQVLLGFCRAGVIGDYVPNSVIKGMLAAIGLILILNQVPHLLGDDTHFETDERVKQDKGNIFFNFAHAFTNINSTALLIGGLCLAFHVGWEKIIEKRKGFIRFIPAPLLIVITGVGINTAFMNVKPAVALSGEHLVRIPVATSANQFFSFFTTPDWSQLFNTDVLIIAVTLALVASLESLLSIEAVDDLDPYQRVTPTNRELKAQGLGNIISGLVGGLPVTSVIVRSSANVNAGAKTKLSTIYHGILLLLSFAFIPFVLNMIPKASLAAILIFTGYKLAKPALFRAFYKKGWDQFLPFIITITAILVADLLKGVIIGIGAGLFFVMRSNFRTAVFVVNDANKYLFRLRKDVSFLNKPIIKNKLELVPADSYVLIDASRADFIDKDIVETIEDFMLHAPLKNIQVELKRSHYKEQGFSDKLPPGKNRRLVRTHEKVLKETANN
ncbi:MAG: SulP family inorganic anion transporter [Chitinophagaceae bacterium]